MRDDWRQWDEEGEVESKPAPTPEAIAQAVARVERLERDCRRAGAGGRILGAGATADADAIRLLLTLAADYVPVQDRERALVCYERVSMDEVDTLSARDWEATAEARRLLKLPAREGA